MKKTTLKIIDEVNIKFEGLDTKTRNKLYKELEYFIPYARHLPSYKLGRWDGKVSFATRGGQSYLNLLDRLLPIVKKDGYEVEIKDFRSEVDLFFPNVDEDLFKDVSWPKGHPKEGEPIILHEHQVNSIQAFLDNPQSLQEISTAAGKTLLTAALSKLCEPYGRTVVIVPNRDLVNQTEEDYRNIGLDVGVFYGGRLEWDKTHTICTWQSLAALERKVKNNKTNEVIMTEEDIKTFLKDVVCVIVDECHSVRGDVLKRLLTGPFAKCPIRWGLSGTIPKDEFEFLNLLLSIGPVVNRITAHELQEKNILSNCSISVLQLQDPGQYKNYQEELSFLLSNNDRLEYIAKQIEEISKTGNTLVLVLQVKAGEFLSNCIDGSSFISGKVKSNERKEEYKSINEENNRVLIATYAIASTGINLPRVFNLVLIEPGKSFIRTIQSIGRGLRKAKDKDFVNIYDICSNLNFSKRHLSKRKVFYKNAKYPFSVKKVLY